MEGEFVQKVKSEPWGDTTQTQNHVIHRVPIHGSVLPKAHARHLRFVLVAGIFVSEAVLELADRNHNFFRGDA